MRENPISKGVENKYVFFALSVLLTKQNSICVMNH